MHELITPDQYEGIKAAYKKLLKDNNLDPDRHVQYVTISECGNDFANNQMSIIVDALPINHKYRCIAGKVRLHRKTYPLITVEQFCWEQPVEPRNQKIFIRMIHLLNRNFDANRLIQSIYEKDFMAIKGVGKSIWREFEYEKSLL